MGFDKKIILCIFSLSCLFLSNPFNLETATAVSKLKEDLILADFPAEILTDTHPFRTLHDQVVQIRGFWYPLTSNQGVLTSFPNLKSCCIRAPTKIFQQLFVKGDVGTLSENKVVTLEGIFKIEPLYSKEKELIQYYVLEQAKEVPKSKSKSIFLFLIIPGIASLFLAWKFKR